MAHTTEMTKPAADGVKLSRRRALKVLGATAATAAAALQPACGSEEFDAYFQAHYLKMSKDEITATLARLEKKYTAAHGVDVKVGNTPALPGVLYGYALNISKCKGYRDCVNACVEENNLSRDPGMAYIKVLELDRGSLNLHHATQDFAHATVPKTDKVYMPVSCMQCDDAPCVKACPVKATWTEPDGITVIDYDWCIGCRYCAVACPYDARHFNWFEPSIPAGELNTDTNYLSNRPRQKGVMEKCTFCLHRVREGRQPACQEACPTGARIFGNLLDPQSELRYVLEHKTVFRLREDLKTEPKFWYYTD